MYLWGIPWGISISTRSPTILCLPFLSTFLSSGSPFLLYFFFWFPFLRVTWWRSIFTATSPRQLFHAQTWPHSHWSVGRLLDKGTGALGFGFLSQKLNCFKHLLFWPYNLNYESSCYFCSTLHSKCVLISAFHKPAESAFFGSCLCLRIGSFTSWLRKLSSYSEHWYFFPSSVSAAEKSASIKAAYNKVSVNWRLKSCIQVFVHFCAVYCLWSWATENFPLLKSAVTFKNVQF